MYRITIIICYILIFNNSEKVYWSSNSITNCFIQRINNESILISNLSVNTFVINPYIQEQILQLNLIVKGSSFTNCFIVNNDTLEYHIRIINREIVFTELKLF